MGSDDRFQEDGQEMSNMWAGPEVSTAAFTKDSEALQKQGHVRKPGGQLRNDEWQYLVVAMVADHILPEASQRTPSSHACGANGVSLSSAMIRFQAGCPVEP